MHSFTIKDRDIQVEDIMKKIEENVRERKKAGFYSDNEIYTISTAGIDLSHNPQPLKDDNLHPAEDENARYSREVETHRDYLNQNWDSILRPPIISHRKIVGPLIIFIRKVVIFLSMPFIRPILKSHVQFNFELVRLLNLLYLKLEALGERQEYLNRFCQELDLKAHTDELKRLKAQEDLRFKRIEGWLKLIKEKIDINIEE